MINVQRTGAIFGGFLDPDSSLNVLNDGRLLQGARSTADL